VELARARPRAALSFAKRALDVRMAAEVDDAARREAERVFAAATAASRSRARSNGRSDALDDW
jgi:hypothetical protein